MRQALLILSLTCGLAPRGLWADVPYTVDVVRVGGEEEGLFYEDPLLEVIRQTSELVGLADRTPRTLATLRSRIESDEEQLVRALRAEGYYDGTVEIAVTGLPEEPTAESLSEEADGEAEPTPAAITITVLSGPQYLLRSFAVDNAHPYKAPFPIVFGLGDIGVALEAPATGSRIVAGQAALIALLGDRGRPFAQVVDRLVIADHEANAVDVTLTVDAGPRAEFGGLEIEGLEEVDEELVRNRIVWAMGDRYDRASVAETRTALAQLEVFNAVSIEPAAEWVDADGRLPMRITVVERDHRTIGGGVSYSTTDGPGARIYWRHRNLLGQAERLELRLTGSRQLQEAAADYRDISVFRDPAYTLTAEASVGQERRENFESRSIETASGISYALDENLSLSAGIRTALSEVDEDEAGIRRYYLLGLPMAADYDLRNDSLNPSEGSLTRFTVEPLLITPDPTVAGLRATLYQTGYWAPFDDDSVVLAGWGQVGSILGSGSGTLPATERFYVGGGGSVRGFAYQFAGDVDNDNDPVGGRSMLALGAEARFRFYDDYGLVAFLEGGRTFDSLLPSFGEELFWGAGAGLRYYTGFGPVRVDLAVPLNGRPGVDDSFQLYVSFGQAF